MASVVSFLMQNACAGIRYRLRRELFGESPDSADMTALQEEVLAQPNVRRLLARRHPDGWIGRELHGGEGLDGSVDALLRAGVERTSPVLQGVVPAVLHPSVNPAYRQTFHGGEALDRSGLGGNRSVAAQVLAQLGAEDNAPVRSEVDAALRCFEEALRYRSVDDFTAKDRQGRRFYKPGLRFPGANHLHLLACTTDWRSASAVAAVRESFRHCTALMSETRETVFLKSGHLIGPFCFNWHLPEFCESDMETPYAFIFFVRELERLAGLAFLTDQLRGAYDTLWTLAAGRAVVERQSESSLRRLRRFAVEPYWRTPENRLCDLLFFALPALYRAGYDVAQLEKGD